MLPLLAVAALLLDPLVALWLADLQADHAPATLARYRSVLARFLAWSAAAEQQPLTLADLTPIALVGYRNALQRLAQPSTVNTHLAALRAWGRWLQQAGYLAANPAARLKLVPRQAPAGPRALAEREVHALLRGAGRSGRYPQRDTALVMLLVQTGLRIGECAALHWGDITLGEKQARLLVRAGKGNKARTVPLNRSACQALVEYAAPLLGVPPTRPAVAAAWSIRLAGPPSTPFWRSERGVMTVSAMERVIGRLAAACVRRGVLSAGMTPHSLRHTFAAHYLAAHPGDLVGLARLLGHSSLDTTKLYLTPSEATIALQVEALDLNAYG